MAENIRKSHRRASKWPICYNTTPESTRSWRHNQGASLSRKDSLPCFQMTLILYQSPKKLTWNFQGFWVDDGFSWFFRVKKSQVVEIHGFPWPLQPVGRTHGPSPCGQAATWCPSGMEDEDEEWRLVGASNPPNGHPSSRTNAIKTRAPAAAGSNAGHENWGGSFWRSSCGWKRFEPWWSTVQGLQRQGAGTARWRELAAMTHHWPTTSIIKVWRNKENPGVSQSSLCWSGFGAVFVHHRCLNEMVKQSVVAGGLDFSWWYQDTGHGLVWCLEIASRARIPKQERRRNGASRWSGIQNLGIKSSLPQRFRLKFPRLFAASEVKPDRWGRQNVAGKTWKTWCGSGGSTDVWLVKVKGWNINKGGC